MELRRAALPPRPSRRGGPSARAALRPPWPAPSANRSTARPRPQVVVAPEVGERRGRHRRGRLVARPASAAAGPAEPPDLGRLRCRPRGRHRLRAGRPASDGLQRVVVPAGILAVGDQRAGSAGATMRTGRPSTPGAGRPACRHRPRSAPRGWRTPTSAGTRSPSSRRVTGWPATARASSGWPCRVSQSAEPSPWGRARARIVRREDLVDVVEQGRGLDERADRPGAPRLDPRREPTRRPRRPRARAAGTRPGDRGRAGGRRPPPAPGTVIGSMVPDASAAERPGRTADRAAVGRVESARDRGRGPPAGSRTEREARPSDPSAGRAVAAPGPPGRPRHGRSAGRPERHLDASRRDRSGGRGRPRRRAARASARAGWPYGLPAPAEAIAIRGRTASTNACVVAVRLPWWATFSRSTGAGRAASRTGRSPPRHRPPAGTGGRRPRRGARSRRR